MARNGFSWATFCRSPLEGRAESRRWISWKKSVAGDAASAIYELVVNDVARYLAQVDPHFELAAVPLTTVQHDHPDPYTPREIALLMEYHAMDPFTTLRRRAMNLLSFYWGGRRGEQSRADDQDVDLERLVLHMVLPGKRGKKRRVPLPSLLASPKRALVAYLEEKRRRFPSSTALWVDRHGSRMSASDLSRDTFHMSQELGFPVSFNRWRRSWQTTMRRSGVRKEIAKYIQGHTWGRDSTDHYWTPDVEDVRAELGACKVPGFIRSREARRVAAPLPVPFAGEIESAAVI
ncbi:MAG: site-specific integrase [Candidatus Thermoplasmatota archaeon]|jgi:site-specific recombinase XerD